MDRRQGMLVALPRTNRAVTHIRPTNRGLYVVAQTGEPLEHPASRIARYLAYSGLLFLRDGAPFSAHEYPVAVAVLA